MDVAKYDPKMETLRYDGVRMSLTEPDERASELRWPNKDGEDDHGREPGDGREPAKGKEDSNTFKGAIENWLDNKSASLSRQAMAAVKGKGKITEEGKALLQGIREGKLDGSPLYRGASNYEAKMTGPGKYLSMQVGQEVQLPPSSFTKDESVARDFSMSDGLDDKTGTPKAGTPPGSPDYRFVDITVSGSKSGITVGDHIPKDSFYQAGHEVITGGRFRVDSIVTTGQRVQIGLTHLGVL